MTLSIITPVRDGGVAFRRSLQSLLGTDPPADEVIVVADGVTDGSDDWAEAAGARVVRLAEPDGPALPDSALPWRRPRALSCGARSACPRGAPLPPPRGVGEPSGHDHASGDGATRAGGAAVIDQARMAARFARGLFGFLRRPPLDIASAEAQLAGQLAGREGSFLRVAERGIFGNPRSPYLPLLSRAGLGYGDLAALVRRDGLDAALAALHEAGVHVTLDEFKGRRPIRRPGLEHACRSGDFDNPLLARHYETRTGGSRGAGAPRNRSALRGTEGASVDRAPRRRGVARSGVKGRGQRAAGIALLAGLAAWDLASRLSGSPAFPTCSRTLVISWMLIESGAIVAPLVASLGSLVAGFAIASAAGVAVGALMGVSRTAEHLFDLHVHALLAAPPLSGGRWLWPRSWDLPSARRGSACRAS